MPKMSIYGGAPVEDLLALAGGDNRSGRINSAVERYLLVVKRDQPLLAKQEWLLICDVLNGTIISADMLPHLAHEIEDAIKIDRVDEKWGVNGPELVNKMRGMAAGQLVAIVEAVERWWAAEGSNDERLKAAGVRV